MIHYSNRYRARDGRGEKKLPDVIRSTTRDVRHGGTSDRGDSTVLFSDRTRSFRGLKMQLQLCRFSAINIISPRAKKRLSVALMFSCDRFTIDSLLAKYFALFT